MVSRYETRYFPNILYSPMIFSEMGTARTYSKIIYFKEYMKEQIYSELADTVICQYVYWIFLL